jgi:hypothetical protein
MALNMLGYRETAIRDTWAKTIGKAYITFEQTTLCWRCWCKPLTDAPPEVYNSTELPRLLDCHTYDEMLPVIKDIESWCGRYDLGSGGDFRLPPSGEWVEEFMYRSTTNKEQQG